MTETEIPPLNVYVVGTSVKGDKRPEELRTSHKTYVLNAINPVLQIAGYDPARQELYISVLDNPVVLSGSIGQASDTVNTTGTMQNPNGRLLPVSNGAEYCCKGQNEAWISTNTYPTRVAISVVRKI
jgi:hypothetical protein